MRTNLRTFLLLACFALSLPASAVDIDKLTYTLNEKDLTATVTGLVGGTSAARGDFIIPESVEYDGNKYIVTSIGGSAFSNCSGFTGSLVIPESVTEIGQFAFADCSGFTGSLTIPNSVTTIGDWAFDRCSGFTGSLVIPESVTIIGRYAFANCSGFTGSLTIPNSVAEIGYGAFCYCKGFNGSLTIPNSITEIAKSTFSGCSGLSGELVIPNSVTFIGNNSFRECSGFTGDLIIPESVTSIDFAAFAECEGLNGNLILPNSVTSIGRGAFMHCHRLTGELTIPDGITIIEESTFNDCNFHKIVLPKDIKTIGEFAFSVSDLKEIIVLAVDPPIVNKNSFIITIRIINGIPESEYYDYCLIVPDESVATYKSTSIWNKFAEIRGLNEIKPNTIELEPAELKIMVGETATLTAKITPENTTDKIVIWSSSDETVATVSEDGVVTGIKQGTATITAETTNGLKATCTVTVTPYTTTIEGINIEFIHGGGENGEDVVKVISGDPDSDGTLRIPAEIEIDGKMYPVTEIGEGAFKDRTDIKKLIIPASVVKIGNEAFSGCTKLIEVVAEDGSKTMECGNAAFKNAPVETLYLGRNTTGKPFAENDALTDLTIGDKVTSIGARDFGGCKSIQNITVLAAVPPALPYAGFEQVVYKNVAPRVPDSSADEYKSADGWKNFYDILGINEIRPIEITIDIPSMELTEGETATLTATITPEDATDKTIAWSSSDSKITTVDANGLVTAIKPGTATITAATSNGLTAKCEITVVAATIDATGVTLNLEDAELIEGNTLQLIATVAPEDATDKTVTWTSSDSKIATVDATGLVTAIMPGTATITVATSNGLTAKCEITVVAATIDATGVTLNLEDAELIEGNTLQLIATVAPEDATDKTITWSSSNSKIATVDENGLVTAVKPGTATITVATSNGLTAKCEIKVVEKPSGIEGVDGEKKSSVRVEGGEIVIEGEGKAEIFNISGARVAVSSSGKVSGLPRGIYLVRFGRKTVKIRL